MKCIFIVNDIRNCLFGLVKACVYGFYKSRKEQFVMSFTITFAGEREAGVCKLQTFRVWLYDSMVCEIMACFLLIRYIIRTVKSDREGFSGFDFIILAVYDMLL